MRWNYLVVTALAWSALCPPARGAEPKPEEKQWKLQFRICQGDPLGSVEQKTVAVLGAPTVVVLSQRQFSFFVGSELALPRQPESKPTATPPNIAITPTANHRTTTSQHVTH